MGPDSSGMPSGGRAKVGAGWVVTVSLGGVSGGTWGQEQQLK